MTVYEDLLVRNAEDLTAVKLGYMKESEVRQTTVHFKADTGAHRNVITRNVFEKLGLQKEGEQIFKLAGGQPALLDVSSQMEISWRNRKIKLDAAVVPQEANNLLSITAMELLDIMPDPSKGCLIGIHGDEYLNELE
jgi:predicted aspartyl protease